MSNNVTTEKLEQLKGFVDKSKNLLNKAEGRLESLENQEKDIITQIESYGIKPENLHEEISKIDAEMNDLYDKAKQLIPLDLLN